MAVKIRIDFFSNTDGAQKSKKAIKDVEKTTQSASKNMQKNWKDVAAAVGVAYIGLSRLKQFFDGLLNTYEQQLTAETKLQGALRATGHAAGFSYEELQKMAEGLSEVTTFADEAALEAESLLLTFTKIGKDVFPDALEAAADMSTMFGQSLTQSAIQLGTALNDPIAGIGRLRRIGISFTEEQKEMIRGFVEMNDIAAAQGVILKELQVEFGGVARAMGENALGALKQLNNEWVDMKEKAGEAFLEGIMPLVVSMREFVAFLEENVDIFTLIGQAIAFMGKAVIQVIKFIIQFKEAILAFTVVAYGIPAAMNLATTAMKLFNAVILANPYALLIAGIVGAIAALTKLVTKSREARQEFQNIKKETEALQEGLLLDAAIGGIKNVGELQAAVGKLDAQLLKLGEQASNSNAQQLEDILRLTLAYSDLKDKIEGQIEIRKRAQLVEDAQAQNLVVYEDYVKALEEINRKVNQFRSDIEKLTEARRKQAELAGTEFVPPDIPGLQKGLKYWEDLARQVSATAVEVQKYGAEFKEVLERRAALEEDFNNKFFNLVSDRITILEQERDAAIAEAEEVGAEVANINAYYSELIQRENAKVIEDRRRFEEDFLRKYNDLILSRVELLEIEKDEALALAREKGADTLGIEKYYAELITRTRIEEADKAAEEEKKALAELESEYKAHAEARKRFQEDVVNYLIGLSDQWLLSESELLRKQRDQEIQNVEDIASKWREEIGYIVDSAGQISLNMDPPEDFAAGIDDVARTQEEINVYAEEYEKILQKALETEVRIGQAKTSITDEFQEQISTAERQEQLAGMVGEEYLDFYGIMQNITSEMKTQEQVQRDSIQEQISGLSQLITAVESNMRLAGISADDIIQSLPYLEIINNANEAIIYLQEELSKIPTEADKAFLELTEKVGSISQKYLDPLEKKKQVLEEELQQVTEYLILLRFQQKAQMEHINTLKYGTEIYQQEYEALITLGGTVQGIEELSENLNNQLAAVDTEIAAGDQEGAGGLLNTAVDGLAGVLQWLTDLFISLITSTDTWQTYMEDFNTILVSLMENAVIPLLDAIQPIVELVIEIVTVFSSLLIPIFKMFGNLIQSLMPLWIVLGKILIQLAGIIQALAPIFFIVGKLVGDILTPILATFSGVLSFAGEIISALNPVLDFLGYVADAVGKVFQSLWKIVEFLTSPIRALGELIFYIVTFQWDEIGGIDVMTPKELVSELQKIWTEGWDSAKFNDFVIDPQSIGNIELGIDDSGLTDPSLGTTIYGGNVTVQQAPDVYFYNTFTGPVIGYSGLAEVGEFMARAYNEYVSQGGNYVIESE